MKPSNLPQFIDLAWATRMPCMIWGPPGVGKSRIIAQWTAENQLPLIDRRLSQMEPTDLMGLPTIKDGRTTWTRPEFFPDEQAHGPEGILFLDEITSAPPQLSAAAYQLVHDRRIGNHVLPDGWLVIAAGNRTGDKGVTHAMPAPLANRFRHATIEADLDDLRAYGMRTGWSSQVLAFLAARPDMLFQFDPRSSDPAFPTPRSWEALDRDYRYGIHPEILSDVICGHVGQGVGTEFIGYLSIAEHVIPPTKILSDPDGVELPKDSSIAFASVVSLATVVKRDEMAAAYRYISRISDAPSLGAEFGVLFSRDVVSRSDGDNLTKTDAFVKWAVANAEVIVG